MDSNLGKHSEGGRECHRHSKSRKKVPVVKTPEPEPIQDDQQQIGIIKEETEEELALLGPSAGRPMTGGSRRPMSSVSTLSRPGSRYTRPSTSKSRTSSTETHSGSTSPTRRVCKIYMLVLFELMLQCYWALQGNHVCSPCSTPSNTGQ